MADPFVAHASVTIEYDHSLPIFRSSGANHSPRNYQRVTIEVREDGMQTHLSVMEQGNKTRRESEHSERSWRMVLHGVEALLEGTAVVPARSEERDEVNGGALRVLGRRHW